MLPKFLRRGPAKLETPQANAPPGNLIYAIGDVHGRLDLLEQLISSIDLDSAKNPDAQKTLIFLGDLIDRGPNSAQVIDFCLKLAREREGVRFLTGNHEEVYRLALGGDMRALTLFSRIGGRETILSYGVSMEEYLAADFERLLEMLRQRVPQEHIDFVDGFEDMIVLGDYAFVHAGIRPNRPLAEQKISDLRWIRDEFLRSPSPLEKVIVHGHTISEDVEIQPHRIGLDTGAYKSGKLSAMGFSGGTRWIVSAIS